MLDSILKYLLTGVTLIEDEYGAINKILSRQVGSYASNSGRKVCFLEPPDRNTPGEANFSQTSSDSGFDVSVESDHLINSGGVQNNAVVFRTDQRYLPLEELKFDIIIFDSFSSYLFGKTDKEVVDLMDEILRLSRSGKSFVLTTESGMLKEHVNAYIRASVDTVIIVRTEIAQFKINRLLYIPKMKSAKPYDRLIKITIEEEGVDIDTREFVG